MTPYFSPCLPLVSLLTHQDKDQCQTVLTFWVSFFSGAAVMPRSLRTIGTRSDRNKHAAYIAGRGEKNRYHSPLDGATRGNSLLREVISLSTY